MFEKFKEEPTYKVCEFLKYSRNANIYMEEDFCINVEMGTLSNIAIYNIMTVGLVIYTYIINVDEYYTYFLNKERCQKINKIKERIVND